MQRRIIISAITILCLVCGCNKVPRDVIAPEIMENLLIDIHKAEAYMENNYSKFQTAANKDSVKASVYAKHNVSKADFDTSIIWYGANLEEFIAFEKVYAVGGSFMMKGDIVENCKQINAIVNK